MKINVKIYHSILPSGDYYYARLVHPLSLSESIMNWYSSVAGAWWYELNFYKKKEILWPEEGSGKKFSKLWQKGEVDFAKFWKRVVTDIAVSEPKTTINTNQPFEFVFTLFPITNPKGNFKRRTVGNILDLVSEKVGKELLYLVKCPKGFFNRIEDNELGNELQYEFIPDIDLGEGGKGIEGYWKRYLNFPMMDPLNSEKINTEVEGGFDKFEYYLSQRVKFAYEIYRLFPDSFSKMYS